MGRTQLPPLLGLALYPLGLIRTALFREMPVGLPTQGGGESLLPRLAVLRVIPRPQPARIICVPLPQLHQGLLACLYCRFALLLERRIKHLRLAILRRRVRLIAGARRLGPDPFARRLVRTERALQRLHRQPPVDIRCLHVQAWIATMPDREPGPPLLDREVVAKYDDVVIDVGGRDTGSLRAALTVADTLLIPVQPRTFDVWSVEQMAELVREARAVNDRLCAIAVLSAADSAGKDNDEAAAALVAADGVACLDVRVIRRKAFPNAAAVGRSVIEQAGQDPKAAAELAALVAALYDGACIAR
jgi:hypothetical protein